MSDPSAELVARARTELAAARTLVSASFPSQATSRAYYAAFYAAEAALLTLGETRGEHSAVISAFGRLVVKQGGADPKLAASLRRLFAARGEADYGSGATRDEADAAIADAEAVVEAVAAWISSTG